MAAARETAAPRTEWHEQRLP